MENIAREIVELHDFFEDWLTARIEQTRETFERVLSTMGEGFYLVTPSGELIERPALLDSIYSGYGSRPGFRMWIEQVQVRHTRGDVIVATYEEWQSWENTDQVTSRLSTVVFTCSEAAVNGVLWQCVHETWMQQQKDR
jgi:hypothetical protein